MAINQIFSILSIENYLYPAEKAYLGIINVVKSIACSTVSYSK
jgi:hypothetical protein